ncbi:hypothetical protein BJX96DRAFT_143424 [Aspergillus floccosus]
MDRLPVRTHHCRFCNHLLLATTRDLAALPRRKAPAQDAAIILPLPTRDTHETETESDQPANNTKEPEPQPQPQPESGTTHNEAEREREDKTTPTAAASTQPQPHYTILLSTTIPERKPTLIRREDGFEKRLLLRCGRCRVVVGYFLDPAHFADAGAGREDDEEEEEGARVVYVLPGAVMETGIMGEEEKMKAMDGAWSGWVRDSI